jgi:hypothetical protein
MRWVNRRDGTYKAVDLAAFPNMTRYCGGYGFTLTGLREKG